MKGLFINEREFDRIKMFKKRVQGLLFSAIVDYWYCGERINTLPIAAQFVYDDICYNIDKLKTCKKNDEKISKNDNISIKNDEKSERATIHDFADTQQHNHPQDKDKDKYINTKTSAKAESKGRAAGSHEKSDNRREQALPVHVQLEVIGMHKGEWLSKSRRHLGKKSIEKTRKA